MTCFDGEKCMKWLLAQRVDAVTQTQLAGSTGGTRAPPTPTAVLPFCAVGASETN